MPTLAYPIRVPSDLLETLGKFTGHFWSDTLALEPFICEAIQNYMHPAPPAPTESTPASEAGYQWKQVFLPAGTRLRASFGGENYYAQVDGDEIRYGRQTMSPSHFANLRGSGNRNAWKAVWLRLPGSEEWLLADVCRTARKLVIARLLGGGAAVERPHQERRHQPAERRTASGQTQDQRAPDLGRQAPAQQNATRESPSCAAGELAVQAAVPGSGSQVRSGAGKGRRGKRRGAKNLRRNRA